MRGELAPHPAKVLRNVLVLLRNCRVYRTLDRRKFLISHILHILAHLGQVNVKTAPDVLTVLTGRLDEEPGAKDVPDGSRAREHDVSKLLLRPQLIESGLLEELHGKLVEKRVLPTVFGLCTIILEVAHEAVVFVVGVRDGEV